MTTYRTYRGFLCQHVPSVTAKIECLKRAGAEQLQLVFDFDRTLTTSRPGMADDVTTWHILKEHLPKAAKAKYLRLFEHYRALELNHSMNHEHAIIWWSAILDLFVEYRLDMAEVERDFLAKATIRPGTKELFDLCAATGIPTIILSAGIKDVIELWAQAYDVKPTIILSTSLQVDANKHVCGWDRSSLIHTLNKKEVGHPELTRIRSGRSTTILVGDATTDADMAEGVDSVFRIRIQDPHADEKVSIDSLQEQTFKLFDAVIEAGDLHAVTQLVKQII